MSATSSPYPAEQIYQALNAAATCAQHLNEDLIPRGTTRVKILAELTSILKHGIAFSILSVSPPEEANLSSDDSIVKEILKSINVFLSVCEASLKPHCTALLQDRLLVIWPGVFRWIEFMHPDTCRVSPTGTTRSVCPVIALIIRTYAVAFTGPRAHVQRLILDRPDVLSLVFSLWLYFPHHIPASATVADVHCRNLIHAVRLIFRTVDSWAEPGRRSPTAAQTPNAKIARESCVSALGGATTSVQALYGCLADQTRHLIALSASGATWTEHFDVQYQVVRIPSFLCNPCPRAVLTATIAGGRHCIVQDVSAHEGALAAVSFVLALCRASDDNRPLIRAIHAGAYDLVERIGKVDASYDVSAFVGQVGAGLGQVSVLRAFNRKHAAVLREPDIAWTSLNYRAIAHTFRSHYSFYREGTMRELGPQRSYLKCHNEEGPGPHQDSAKVCPCGDAFYCSKSCQRAHWRSTHRATCCAADGPWGMQGRMSIADIMYLCKDAFQLVIAHSETMALAQRVAEMFRAKKRPMIVVDLSNVFPCEIAHVEELDAGRQPLKNALYVDLRWRMGGTEPRRMLPFKYPLQYIGETLQHQKEERRARGNRGGAAA
ncbi:hypothetical protein BD626DRAFT_259392 [Schizophyllum amplum]|uniref:MYND-type domain-containing protein n=1 Tax=Schizophyllum amplum TaxID=97359 RepID=A0A550BUF8_9AGAR|nr:hypothetical protein BD626DRAFT_259392 [Auriculariopsis ampla]